MYNVQFFMSIDIKNIQKLPTKKETVIGCGKKTGIKKPVYLYARFGQD